MMWLIIKKSYQKKKYRPYFNIIDGKMTLDESFKLSKPYKILSSLPGRSFVYISQFSRIAQLFRESYVQYYNPVVTQEVFIELNSDLVYRGMIDNSYQELGQWALPTENYIFDVLIVRLLL